jgi:hypothetical protein
MKTKLQLCHICDEPTGKAEDDQVLLCGQSICESCLNNEKIIDEYARYHLSDKQWDSDYTMFFLKDKIEYLMNL